MIALAPNCSKGDNTVGFYHNHPPNHTNAKLSPSDIDIAKRGKPPYGHPDPSLPDAPEGLPPNVAVGATQKDKDGKFSTQIYDPIAPKGMQITNIKH